jgi:peptidoglycan/xylan/chitin deacetylase (PgdA/CDA1 family)
LNVATRALPARVLGSLAGENLIAPCYHLVCESEPPQHVRQLFQCPDPRTFEKDLDRLLKHHIPVSLNDLEEHVRLGKKLPRHAVFVSFDDGMREMDEIVSPLCLRKGIPATFFLTTAFLDNRVLGFRHKASILLDELKGMAANGKKLEEIRRRMGLRGVQVADVPVFLRGVRYRQTNYLDECAVVMGIDFDEYLSDKKPYLTEAQVESLMDKGFSIGGHSVDHPLFADLDFGEQVAQTQGCMEHLAQRFAVRSRAFAFPFVSTGVSNEYYDTVFGKGIVEMVFCIGEIPSGYNPRIVKRFGVESSQNRSATAAWRKYASSSLKNRLSRFFRKPRAATV